MQQENWAGGLTPDFLRVPCTKQFANPFCFERLGLTHPPTAAAAAEILRLKHPQVHMS